MSRFIEVKTAELTGPALDWAVAVADAEEHPQVYDGVVYVNGPKSNALAMAYSPTTNWEQGGPLIEHYRIQIAPMRRRQWLAMHEAGDFSSDSPLTSICRAVVAAELGDEVQVPAELVEVMK